MALEYEKTIEVQCKFRGSDLKKARRARRPRMSRYKMALAINTYQQQIQRWEEADFVKIDEFTMRMILVALGQERDTPASL